MTRVRFGRAVALVVVCTAAALGPARPAGAESVDDILSSVAIESERYDAIKVDIADTERLVVEAGGTITRTERLLDELYNTERLLDGSIPSYRQRIVDADAALSETRAELRTLAVVSYVGGGRTATLEALMSGAERSTDRAERYVLLDVANANRLAEVLQRTKQLRDADFALETALADLDSLRARIAAEESTLATARDARENGESALPQLRQDLVDARWTATVRGADFPVYVLAAYVKAAASQPGCNLPWSVLAGIGRVESRHGTYRGSTVGLDGRVDPPILGIALDGSRSRPVADTDGGAFDGDDRWDRAIGPMQFIPSTWSRWAADGNDDGVADPQNVYDAARAAAGYLCYRGDVSDPAALQQAVYSYNHSEFYVARVLQLAGEYAAAVG